MGTLRRAARSALVVAFRRPWLPPGLAVVIIAIGGQLGRGWLYATLGLVVAGGLALVGGSLSLERDNS